MLIGTFEVCGDGYAGRLHTLTCDAAITIVRAQPSAAENAPAWRLLLGDAASGIEIGAGWNRTGERAGAFIAVQTHDPAFAVPLRPDRRSGTGVRLGQGGAGRGTRMGERHNKKKTT